MINLYIIYAFVLLTLGINLFSFLKRRQNLKGSEQLLYLYLLLTVFGWIITNAVADLSKNYEIASTSARLAILFPLNFMSAFLGIASIFPQSINRKRSLFVNLILIGTILLTGVFAFGINSDNNLTAFKIVMDGPAEYAPGGFYSVSLLYAIIILITALTHWFGNIKNYTRTQRSQIFVLVTTLAIVYVSLGIGLTYFPAVGLIEYGPTAFISLGLLLYVTNQTFFIKAFLADIREDIVRILTIILLSILTTSAVYIFQRYQDEISTLGVVLSAITLLSILYLIGNEFIKSTQVGFERLKGQVLEFNSKTATIFERPKIKEELKKTLMSMFPRTEIKIEFTPNSKDPVTELTMKWWKENDSTEPITPEIVIDRSYSNKNFAPWLEKYFRTLIEKKIILIIPLLKDKGIFGLVKLSGGNISLESKEYELIQLLAQNASISISRADLYSEVTKFNLELEQKVRNQTKEINEKYELLLAAQQRERDMIDIMGHELRTPISIIRLQFELMIQKLKGSKLLSTLDNYINNISSAILREGRLINSLLGATKLDQNKLELSIETFKIVETLRESYEAHIHDINKKGLKFLFKTPKGAEAWEIEIDKTRMLEVFDNLISNAVKYTHEGEIQVELSKEKGSYIIEIKDSGVGISKEGLKHLGEKFYRADTAEKHLVTRPGGTGLGLYVSIGIVEKHGGKFDVQSEPGKGSVFTVKIPIKQKVKTAKRTQSLNVFEQLGLKK